MNSLTVALFVAVAVAYASAIQPLDTAAVVTGPSGQIVRSGIAPIAAPLAYAHGPIAAPLIARSAIAAPLAYAVPAGSGLEGQWIPDINEKLYDDGSYKPYIYGL